METNAPVNGAEQREKDLIILYVTHTKQAWHGESEANESGVVM